MTTHTHQNHLNTVPCAWYCFHRLRGMHPPKNNMNDQVQLHAIDPRSLCPWIDSIAQSKRKLDCFQLYQPKGHRNGRMAFDPSVKHIEHPCHRKDIWGWHTHIHQLIRQNDGYHSKHQSKHIVSRATSSSRIVRPHLMVLAESNETIQCKQCHVVWAGKTRK